MAPPVNTRIDLVNAQIHRGTKAERLAMVIDKSAGLHLWYEIDAQTQLEESCWIVDVDPTTDPPFAYSWKPFCVSPIPPVLLYKFAGAAVGTGQTSTGYLADSTGEDLGGALSDTRSLDALKYLIMHAASKLSVGLSTRDNTLVNEGLLEVLIANTVVFSTPIGPGVNTTEFFPGIPVTVIAGDVLDVRVTINETEGPSVALTVIAELGT